MGARVRYLLPADGPAPGRFSVIEYTVPAFYAAPPTLHHHLEDEWAAVVLEGRVTFEFKTGSKVADTGAFVWCPHGSPFAWRNDSNQPARYFPWSNALFEPSYADMRGWLDSPFFYPKCQQL